MTQNKRNNYFYLSLITLIACIYIQCSCKDSSDRIQNESLQAFAQTYGAIRWFYPSDEAQTVDWNQLAIDGVSEMMKCKNEKEILKTLKNIFDTIAPNASFYYGKNKESQQSIKNNNDSLVPVFWQHAGLETQKSNYYTSKRLNRDHSGENLNKLSLFKYIPCGIYSNHKAKLKMAIRTIPESSDFHAELLLACYAGGDEFMNVIKNNPLQKLQSPEWKIVEKEINLRINSEVIWGIYTEGKGSLDVDNIELLIEEDGKWKQIFSDDFENQETKMTQSDFLYSYRYIHEKTFAGNYSIRINKKNELFERYPDKNETVNLKLSKNISLQFPLTLYLDRQYESLIPEATSSKDSKNNQDTTSLVNNKVTQIADIIVAWNVIKHFSPYQAFSKANWDFELDKAIDTILNDKNRDSAYAMDIMMSALNDAHYYYGGFDWENYWKKFRLPFVATKIEQQIVILKTFNDLFQPGDIIEKINEKQAIDLFEDAEKRISGSESSKRITASEQFWDLFDSSEKISISVKRGDIKFLKEISPVDGYKYYSEQQKSATDSIKVYPHAIYFDISRLQFTQIINLLSKHKEKMFIFDMRKGHSEFLIRYILPYLGDNDFYDMTSIPTIIRPNEVYFENKSGTTFTKQNHPPQSIFLVGGENMSNHESFLDYVKCKKIGILIGENTAGCSGMANFVNLPSGVDFIFTGARAFSLCGEDFYSCGISPDYKIIPTIDDIIKDKDVALEKALEIAKIKLIY